MCFPAMYLKESKKVNSVWLKPGSRVTESTIQADPKVRDPDFEITNNFSFKKLLYWKVKSYFISTSFVSVHHCIVELVY